MGTSISESETRRLLTINKELEKERERVKNIEDFLSTLVNRSMLQEGDESAASTSKGKGKKKSPEPSHGMFSFNKLASYFSNVANRDMDQESNTGSAKSSRSRRSNRSLNVGDIDEDAPLAACYKDRPYRDSPPSRYPKPGPEEKWVWCEKLQLQFNSSDLGKLSNWHFNLLNLCNKLKIWFFFQISLVLIAH